MCIRDSGEPASPARRGELCFRQTVIPGQKTARFRQRLRRRLKEPALSFHTQVEYEHSRLGAASGEAWDALETAIEIQFERAVIAPCLCPFITDSRFYAAAWDKVYRFSPFLVTGEEALSGLCTVTGPNLQTAVQFCRSCLLYTSAPSFRARSKRFSLGSSMTTRTAPQSRASCSIIMPMVPPPMTITVSPGLMPHRSMPCRAQATGSHRAASSKGTLDVYKRQDHCGVRAGTG